MATYYAAVDMGASSGRLILGHMENGRNLKRSIVLRTVWSKRMANSVGSLTVFLKKS